MKQQYYSMKIGKVYRITAEPKDKPKNFPGIDAVGICKWTSSHNGVCLQIDKQFVILPLECVILNEETNDNQLENIIKANPKSAYKLLKGLWRMTKHKAIRDLMERGEFPPDPVPVTASESYKRSEEYDRQWSEAEQAAAGAFANEIIS